MYRETEGKKAQVRERQTERIRECVYERERQRETERVRERETHGNICVNAHVLNSLGEYMHIYIYREREGESARNLLVTAYVFESRVAQYILCTYIVYMNMHVYSLYK